MSSNFLVEIVEHMTRCSSDISLMFYISTEEVKDLPQLLLYKLLLIKGTSFLISITLSQSFSTSNESIKCLFDNSILHLNDKLFLQFTTSMILVLNSQFPLI